MDLPEGTVTLLFTDIEGSTDLLRRLGARYAEVQNRHRQILRAAFDTFGGVEVDTQGDAFMVAFRSASDAAAAAVLSQQALADETWPESLAMLVRMGLHTGEPERGPEGYVGMDVHIAARICAAGHGGQIIVSRTTKDFVGEDTSREISFRPLGSHRLKDVPTPEQLFQLIAPGLPESFPPLRTMGGATLPALHHRLVGRRRDLTATLSLLARPDVRLVTIIGPGGAGKSRLALEVAGLAAVQRPVHLVGLAPVSDPELVRAAIARALGVRESGSRPLTESIAHTLAGTGALLLLDNLEHLAPAARDIAELLDRAPDLDILATSRVPLRLSGEHVVPLDPLTAHDAAVLFAELAAARGVVLRDEAMPAVREICRRLDGLPLAIELVAARLAVLPPAQLLRALDEGLTLDMEGPVDLPERQRTLRATIDWSYGLLSDSQRELHQTLAVFVGGCTLEDGQALAGSGSGFLADLEALVAGSLARSEVTVGEGRLFMLETVREDAIARLVAAGRFDDLRQRHAERFVELAVAAEAELTGPNQAEWLERLEHELDNIRAALDWCLVSGRVEAALRAMSGLSRFWRGHGHVSEARRWLSHGLAIAEGVSADARADALFTAARQATAQSDLDAAVPLFEEALAIVRELGRSDREASVLSELGWIAFSLGQHDRAAGLSEEALSVARAAGDVRATASALNVLADVFAAREDHKSALELQEEALALRRTLSDPLLVADSTYHLGVASFRSGNLDRARVAFNEALALARDLGEVGETAAVLFMLAELDLLTGAISQAEERIRESLAVYTELENDRDRSMCLVVLAGIAAAKSSFEEGAQLLGAAEALRGDAPPDLFELPVLERLEPELEGALGEDRLTRLRAEGARLGPDVVVHEVVFSGIEE
jgi:predicted ATPase/class 3 adenylate cyclase